MSNTANITIPTTVTVVAGSLEQSESIARSAAADLIQGDSVLVESMNGQTLGTWRVTAPGKLGHATYAGDDTKGWLMSSDVVLA